ncbi:MAG TPA: DUF3592 domain-containing protein [Streptosporangiaceae bacterium]|nr:DUF3592 domain-containing protein [Streptosporangiaceae bacterium]
MSVVIGAWFAFAGGVAALAGLTAMHGTRRLRRTGVRTWAMVLPLPGPAGEVSDRAMLQYTLQDGRVLERICPGPPRPADGQRVLVWYDPVDPQDVLIYGRNGRFANRAFLTAGALFIVLGIWIAAVGR